MRLHLCIVQTATCTLLTVAILVARVAVKLARLTYTWTALQLSLTRLSTHVSFSACLPTSMQVHIAAGKFRLLPGGNSLAHEDLSGASIISLAWQCLFYGSTIECEISDSPADKLLERFLPRGRWKLAGVEKHDELKCADALYLLYKQM